ncbi:metallophosphoesterase family protein [Halorubrum vacuolatum]|uniref:Serine/threonine protein phosphatase 1 n=1 Tax=Halorubrum vacuolatum TaxID=63740 RepID=A0A238UUU9_HALVU|nr:metallophosphoesterase family protein [Halorubrum vacuolatum]SNR25818.1 serine/threonine protein phosphatase 1 [Halorubrum vacuolatum]
MTPFSEAIEADHRRVNVANWDQIYIVGDPHGCLTELDELCATLDLTDNDLVVFVGDIVRKGPDSKGVVDRVRNAPNMLTVRGNNEEKLLRGDKQLDELTDDDLEWIASLPVVISLPNTLVVHGGIDPRKPRADHTVDDLQNTRSMVPGGSYDPPYWFEEYAGPERVFFGHTVLEKPVVREHAVGLDTGCVYGGELTAYNWRTGELTAVPAAETAIDRSEEKILDPKVSVVPTP